MKRAGLLIAVLGLSLCLPGCGFTEGTDAVVTVVKYTPTPIPATPTPIPPTPTPEPTPTPVPQPVMEQSPSGLNVEVKQGSYKVVNVDQLNLRADATPDAAVMYSVPVDTVLNSTGVCENGWIRVEWEGSVLYGSGDYLQSVEGQEAAPAEGEAPAEGGAEAPADNNTENTASAESDDTESVIA